MKKLIVYIVLSVLSYMAATAQEPAICGDWVGVYKDDNVVDDKHIYDVDYKRYIRIKNIGGHYTVRMKTRIVDGSRPVNYSPEGHITEATDQKIKWEYYLESTYDWSPKDMRNGIPIGHADYYAYCSVTLQNGVLKYSGYYQAVYYDKQGREIDTDNYHKTTTTLYKEEADW